MQHKRQKRKVLEGGIRKESKCESNSTCFWCFKMQESHARPTGELLKAKDRTWLTASKGARTSVLIRKLNSAYNLNELVRGLFPVFW